MGTISGIQRAIDKFGGSPSKLAAAVGGDVVRQHVEHWVKSGRVPIGKCADVSKATGVSCTDLNDQVDWPALAEALQTAPASASV